MAGLIASILLFCAYGSVYAANDAVPGIQSVPASMTVGETYPISISMKNTGTTWTAAGGYSLVLQNPGGWSVSNIPMVGSAALNTTRAFAATIAPPSTPGTYAFQWCMAQNGMPFGACSTPVSVQVAARAPNAAFSSQSMTATMATPTRAITVTMKNTGNTTWKAGQVVMGIQNPPDNTTWGINRLKLATNVAPNGSGTFSGTITTPPPGYFNMQWQAYEDGTGYFGTPSTDLTVAVAGGPPTLEVVSPTDGQGFIGVGGYITVPFYITGTPTGVATITKTEVMVKDGNGAYLTIIKADGPVLERDYKTTTGGIPTVYIRTTDSFNKTSPVVTWHIVGQTDNSVLVSNSLPATMVPGVQYDVAVVLKNSGQTTWDPQTVSLVPANAAHSTAWGEFSVPLTASVAPGGTAVFNMTLTAPPTEGTFSFAMRLKESTRDLFGATIGKSVTTARIPPTVTMTAPVTGALDIPTDTTTKVQVQGSAVAGMNATISKLDVLDGATVVATVNGGTIDQLLDLPMGTHALRLRATDNWNETALSTIATVTVRANDAAYVTQSVPATMQVGKAYTTSVTMRNAGNKPWTAAAGYALASQNPENNTLWRDARVAPTVTVGAGGQVSFSMPVTAPTAPGTYNFQWRMVQDGVEWFGPQTPNVQVIVKPLAPVVPALNQPLAAQKFVATGAKAYVPLQGNATAGAGAAISLLEVLDGATVIASVEGDTIATEVQLAAGAHTLKMRATDNFGQVVTGTATTAITVLTNNASAVSRTAAATMVGGSVYEVKVVMRNTGTTTWTEEDGYALVQSPDNGTWILGYIPLTGSVAPGANATFTFNVQAPADPATYPFQWQMAHLSTGLFGAVSTLQNIVVTGLPPTVGLTGPASGNTYTAVGGYAQVPVSGTATPTGSAVISKFEVLDGTRVAYTGSGSLLNATVALTPGSHVLQLRATDSRNAVALSQTSTVTVLHNDAAFVGQSVPATMYAGDRYPVTLTVKNTGDTTWQPFSTKTRLGVALAEQPAGNAVWSPSGRVQLNSAVAPGATYTFSFDVIAPAVTKQYQFQWRMSDESKEFFGNLSTPTTVNVGVPPVPVVSLSASPVNQRVAPGKSAMVTLTGLATLQTGLLSKLEVFADSGSGYGATALKTVSGSAAQLAVNDSITLGNGSYRLKLRATDSGGHFADSPPVTVSVTDSALLGQLIGVRSNGPQLQLVGWICRDSSIEALNYQVYVKAPPSLGGVQVASGAANLTGEAGDAGVQQQCHTPGVSHHFAVDIAGLQAQYPGIPLYVSARSAQGETIVLPCEDHGCRIPEGLRIGLTSPNVNNLDRFRSPLPIFARAVVTGYTGALDEVVFNINGEWLPGTAEGAGAYSVSKAGLPPSGTPYAAYAKVRQGETTLITDTHLFYVDAGIGLGTITPKDGATVVFGQPTVLSVVLDTPAQAGQSVKFFITPKAVQAVPKAQRRLLKMAAAIPADTGGSVVGDAVFDGTRWNYAWQPAKAGGYAVAAKLLDGAGAVQMETAGITLTVSSNGDPGSDPGGSTPLPVNILPPHLDNDIAGTLPGSLSVTPAGAATYGIPVVVPPGTAGLQPDLAFNYSSAGTNGVLGLGWSLDGLSSISRCGKTMAQDNMNTRINFEKADRLCLDGKRLVLVNLPLTDENYWSDTAEYRTEIESFSRITAQASSDNRRSFKVETKDGRILTYGSSESSYVKAIIGPLNGGKGEGQPLPKNGAQSWALDTVKDKVGNFIQFSYTQEPVTGEHYPSVVRYGANGMAPHGAVQFLYDARPDAWRKYIDESRNDLRNRLTDVKTYVGADLSGDVTAGALVRDYRLKYEQSPTSGRSLLSTLQVCPHDDANSTKGCLPATAFSWGKPDPDKKPGFESKGIWSGGPSLSTFYQEGDSKVTANHPDYFAFSDFENNGYTDILEKRVRGTGAPLIEANGLAYGTMQPQYRYFHNTGAGFTEYTYQLDSAEPFIVLDTGDFNGDGALDLLVTTSGSASGYAKICLSPLAKPGALGAPGSVIQFTCDATRPAVGANSPLALPYVVDIVGDGRSAHYSTNVYGMVTVCIQDTCQKDGSPPAALTMVGGDDGSDAYARNQYTRLTQVVDFTGIGKPYDVRWNRVNFVKAVRDGNEWIPAGYENLQPTVSINNFNPPGTAFGQGAMASFTYPSYPQPPKNTFYLPYQFDRQTDMGGLTADFNGSGYSGLAFGFLELAWDTNNSYYSYSRAEMTLCLSTGRALDCAVRKKFSGADYLSVRSVNNFVGDGQATILADVLEYPTGQKPRPSGALKMCRVMGDDTTAGAGTNDTNMVCDPWAGFTMPTIGSAQVADNIFFMDLMGTGRTQIVQYHSGKFDAARNWQADDRWEVFAPIDQALPGQALDRIYQVANGFGAVGTVEYVDGISSGTVTRTADVAPSYPQRASPRVGKIVRTLTARNDADVRTPVAKKISYRYENPADDSYGRGALGFAKVVATDELNHTVTSTSYHQIWPLTGMATNTSDVNGGVTLSSSTNTLQFLTLTGTNGQATYFPYVQAVVTTRKDLDGSALGTVTTTSSYGDAWGNLTEQTMEFDDHTYKSTVSTDYLNDTTNWVIGKPKLVTVTRTAADKNTLTRQASYDYDMNTGLLKTEVLSPDVAALTVTTTYDRTANKFGLVNKKTQAWSSPIVTPAHKAAGAQARIVSDVTYEERGRFPLTLKNALGHSETHTYDAATGARIRLTDANGLDTTWALDSFGRIVKEAHADGNETRRDLKQCDSTCPSGAVAVAVSADFHVDKGSPAGVRIATPKLAYYDNVGHLIQTTGWGFDGKEIVQAQRYDAQGRLSEVDRPHVVGTTAYLEHTQEYDDLGRVNKLTSYDELGAPVDTTTLYSGLDIKIKNAKQQTRTEHRTVNGKLARVIDAKGGITSFVYDAFDNLTETTDPDGNVTSVKYDLLGRKTDLIDPDLGWIHYDVDPLGRVWKQTSPKQRAGNTSTVIDFDLLDRMTDRYEPDLESHWTYDDLNNGKGIGQLALAYTVAGKDKDYQRQYTYDNLGRNNQIVQVLKDGRYTSTQVYDDWNRPLTQKYQRNSETEKVYSYRYNNFGRQYKLLRGDLVLAETLGQDAEQRMVDVKLGNGLRQKRQYNPHTARLENAHLTTSADVEHLLETYDYDKLGNVLQRAQHWDGVGFQEVFEYDELNRVGSSTVGGQPVQRFTYSAAGSILTKGNVSGGATYQYPKQGRTATLPHAVKSIDGIGDFFYDANGNLENGAGRTTTWSSFDMPISIVNANGSSSFVYGPEHQRTYQCKVAGGSCEGNNFIVYAGKQEVEVHNGITTVKSYWPNGLGVEIDKTDLSGQTVTELYWTHADRLGSPVLITDASGNIREKLAYDTWGKRRNFDADLVGVIDNKGYTGHEMLDDLDLVHMNGRVYDPLIAKFMSGDPLVQDPLNGQSYNRYSYVLNNPTNLTDPTGFRSEYTVTGSAINFRTPEEAEAHAAGLGVQVTQYRDRSESSSNQATPNTAGTDQVNGKNPSANSKTYFIGGAADKYKEFGQGPTNIMGDVQAEYAKTAPPGADSAYYGYQDRKEIVSDITTIKANDPATDINIVGHSRGAALGINIAANELAKANIQINIMIAIDPVGTRFTTPGLWMPSALSNVTTFINLNASPKNPDVTDRIAWAGGHYGEASRKFTPLYFNLNYNHGQAASMLKSPIVLPNTTAQSAWGYLLKNTQNTGR